MGEGTFYGVVLLGVILGVAGLLAGEFFHGVAVLVPAGGAVALLSVGALTAGIARATPQHEH
jgi:hypothetical protein